MRLSEGLLVLSVLLLVALSAAGPRPPVSFSLARSAPSASIELAADEVVVGRGDDLNLTVWLNVTGNGQFQRTWVNLTFNTAADPTQNSLAQGPTGWTQPVGCVVIRATGWFLEWECVGLRAGVYVWGVPAYVVPGAAVGKYQRVMANTASQTGAGLVSASANATVWIAGSVVRILDVDSLPTDSARGGDVVQFWVNVTNDANVTTDEALNGTGSAYDVVIQVLLDPGLVPSSGAVNLTTRVLSLPPLAVLSVSFEAIVANNLSAGAVVGLSVTLSYQDFNGHPIGPIEASSRPLYVVQSTVLWTPNLIVGAAIGLGAILVTLIVLLYLGQRKIVIDEAFFMTKGGILIRHVSLGPEVKKDDDIVASMFVAIQEFVRDSFQREASLDSVAFGKRRAAVVRGELTVLAAMISHGDVDYVIRELLAAVRAIEAQYWDVLVAWNGNMSRLEGIDEALGHLLRGGFRSPWRVQLA